MDFKQYMMRRPLLCVESRFCGGRHAWGAEVNAGSWAVRVNRFSRRGPVGPFSERNRDMAYEDYLDLNYLWWAQESLRALLPSVKVIR